MNKNVLILVNHEVVIYNFRKELVDKLIKEGHRVTISCPTGSKLEELASMGCHIIQQPIDRRSINPVKDAKLFFDYLRTMLKVQPDVILTYTIKPNIYGGMIASLLKIPFVSTITGLGSALHKESLSKKLMISLYKVALKKASTIFVQNKSNLMFLIENGFNESQLQLVSGSGVNLKEFKMRPYPSLEAPIQILFIGRVMKEKGVYELISAAKLLQEKGHQVEFKLAGFLDDGFQMSDEHVPGNVKLVGAIKDVRESIESSHAIILPSYHEGMSNALLEAAATGRPLLASDIPGCNEIIDDELNGYVFDVKSTESIVEKTEKFLQLPHEHKVLMGQASRNKVTLEFDREKIVDTYYKRIMEVSK
ncbi:glycosyltransferase family 4 protein [Exiguobacterium aestuarii]|uniref:Glycosyltransferase family 4 protein n=1 Tax=Exiguobacterium aestuarii TaxID=273527 RepID=A0ABW2PHM4_9BACL|nr:MULTISPECIES: glycosyltransferase family 4 protein [Exiguobacterium]MCT4785119.1 glycosyltransferase family 4 protein [Exiguobacterium aestuarii]